MGNPLFATKSVDELRADAEHGHGLKRSLTALDLVMLGVGAIIGTGIFVLTGRAAAANAGPAVALSFIIAGTASAFAGLCYAEMASMIPIAGSAYTYSYATMGELVAWIIGWDLVLEYAVGSATVANGWSSYFQSALASFGIALPQAINGPPLAYDPALGRLVASGSVINLPAIAIVAFATAILIVGIKESARLNGVMVGIKVAAVLFVIAVGAFYVKAANWHPFAPYGLTGVSFFGHTLFGQTDAGGRPLGMLAGAALAFFAFIGFDSVSTHAEEARNPQRDVPIGIIASLILCTLLYLGVVAVLTGMVPYHELDVNAPVAAAFERAGLGWAHLLLAVAGVAGITSVLLVMMLSQPRVLLAMARDGLLPASFFGHVHPRFRTPWKSTLATGIFVAILAGLLPIQVLLSLVSMGTLLAFVIVCAAVLILRRTHPGQERPFRVRLVPLVPVLGIAVCLLLMFSLPSENWLRLVVWLAIGLAIYFGYGRRHSLL
jgi:APA family basic amino acid/polyamine antiporter